VKRSGVASRPARPGRLQGPVPGERAAAPAQPAAAAGQPAARSLRRDAAHNYERILEAARDVFGESGSEACIEEIATQAGVGIGTVYRRFASKDALMDELLRLALDEIVAAAERALARPDGHGLEDLLRAFGQSFAEHSRYAPLLLDRQPDAAVTLRIQEAISALTERAVSAGTIGSGVTTSDVTALISGMRGLAETPGNLAPEVWQRFLDIHLAGLRAAKAPGESD
jgi:AcrR family transcriptional regulator